MNETRSDAPAVTGGAAAALFVPVAALVLALAWAAYALPIAVFLGVENALIAAGFLVVAAAAAAVHLETPQGWGSRLGVAAYVLGIAVVAAVAYVVVGAVVVLPLAAALGGGVGAAVAAVVVLALATAVTVGVLLAVGDSSAHADWALNLRMVVACLLLLVLTVGFLVAVWLIVWLVASLFLGGSGLGFPAVVATAVVGGFAVLAVYEEYGQVRTVEARADATPVAPDEYPGLHATVGRVAQQFGVPKPTVAVADRAAPEAMVAGFRPDEMVLVVSTGVLDALSERERTAVVAHELAHVANRDAMVMTAVSAPIVLAEGFREEVATREDLGLVGLAVLAVAAATKVLGRVVVAVLSRSRERTADRAAVAVTGDPAALATALRTLDDAVAETPDTDLRAAASVSALSVVPLDPADADPVMLGPDGTREPFLWEYREPVAEFKARFYRTHPPTAERVAALHELADERSPATT